MLLAVLVLVRLGRWARAMRCANLEGWSVLAGAQRGGCLGAITSCWACRDVGGKAVKAGGMDKATTHEHFHSSECINMIDGCR